MPDSSAIAHCPKCARPLARNAPRGLCAKCLLGTVLGEGPLASPQQISNQRHSLPRFFGSYELLEELARGGMGVVYRARQTHVDRFVALKVLVAGQFAAPDFIQRFRTEAQTVASLEHPNIVPIYDVGDCEGQPFFSMRLVQGGSLAIKLSNGNAPISSTVAARWMATLARAVHFAHQRGILHRDIKPGNVLMDANDEPHLTDFGLAKLVANESTLTRTMAMLGTPSYMSPEQARGGTKELTTAVDIYGLGAVLYELLTGQPPFAGGTTMETVRQVLDHEPRRPSAIRPGVDKDLETICLKCLSKQPSRRYGSAEALAADLERWLHHEPIQARPAPPAERLLKWVRRRPVPAAFLAFTLASIAVIVFTLARANLQIRAAQANEAALRREAESRAEETRQQLVRLNVSKGNQLVEQGDAFKALLWFSEALRLEKGDAAREDIHRRRIGALLRLSPKLDQLWFHDAFVHSAEFSPNGDRVVSASLDHTSRIWDSSTGEPLVPPLLHSEEVAGARFAPDGKRVLTVDGRQRLFFWDASTADRLAEPIQMTAFDATQLDYSPDGRRLAVPVPGGVRLYDSSSTQPVGPLFASTRSVSVARFTPDGLHLVGVADRDLHVWNVKTGQELFPPLSHPDDYIRACAVSHDGRRIATATLRQVRVWDLLQGQLLWPPMEPGGDLFDCRFNRDDRWLAVASWDGTARLIDARTGLRTGDGMRHRAGVARAVFSPASNQLATASWDNTARVWDPPTGKPASPALPHGGYVSFVRFSPDGSRLLTCGQDHTVRLWNLSGNRSARLVLRQDSSAPFLQFTSDGQRLLAAGKTWEVSSGRLLSSLPRASGWTTGPSSQDGRRFVYFSKTGLLLRDSETGDELGTIIPDAPIAAVAFSPDGSRLITGSTGGNARVWNIANGQPVTPLLSHAGAILRVAFSPDARRVLTTSADQTAQVWDAATGQRVGSRLKHPGRVSQAQFSPDGRRLLTACTDTTQLSRAAQMWETETGTPFGPPMPHQDGVLCAQFSPDGRYIATGGEDHVTIIWDATSGARLSPPLPHNSHVQAVHFSPNSRMLLTISGDGSARVWETATGEPVTPPLQHTTGVTAGVWTPNSSEIAIASVDGTISLWDISPVPAPVVEVQRQAELLSAHRLQLNLGAIPLTEKELRSRWTN